MLDVWLMNKTLTHYFLPSNTKNRDYGSCQIHLVLLQASLLAANIIPFFCNLAKIRLIRLMSHM